MSTRTLGRNERTFTMSSQDSSSIFNRSLLVGKQLEIPMIGLKGRGDNSRTNGSTTRLIVSNLLNSYWKQVTSNIVNSFHGNRWIGKVVTKGSIDLDIYESRTDNSVLCINDLFLITLSERYTSSA